MITDNEIQLALGALETARAAGADKARISLSKMTEDLVATLDGEVDKVTHCADRSLSIAIFADGRYGSFSTNKLDVDSLSGFIKRAVSTVRMLAPDPCRQLPSPDRCCTDAVSGRELGLVDESYSCITPEQRVRMALEAATFGKTPDNERYTLISEEGEYSDSEYDLFLADTEGLRCRHSETTFDYGVEVTIEDRDGNKYSDYWWTAAPFHKDFDASDCGRTAIAKAAAQIGSEPCASGKYNMVVCSEVASKMVSPILSALNAYSIQQGNSFLADSMGRSIFPEGMTIVDQPHLQGQTGSKLFDSEGVCTMDTTIIDKGVVKQYFVNTYMSAKLETAPTIEEPTRPRVMPWPKSGLDRYDLMKLCGSGIMVTEFNGGNSNSATGDFSYGISGQRFENGVPAGPVCEMLVTGNFITLWKDLIAVGDDCRSCMSKLIPTLAFANVDFNG